ncbi:MAG TPA: carboxypeptidase-like regulatory domain-containing protein, partial [Vicinamibacteria bacterium]
MTRILRRVALSASSLALLLLTLPPPAAGQAVYGSIAGTVVDSTGAALPGVSVTITSLERKTSDTVVSNTSGNYVKERLIPGNYEVKAELANFKIARVPSVVVSVDTQTPVNF